MNFDKEDFSLLTAVTGDTLKFKSIKTGAEYEARPEDTLLVNGEVGDNIMKYENTIRFTPYDPVNPRILLPEGCDKCKRKIVSYQRFGSAKKVVYVCLCGNQWST